MEKINQVVFYKIEKAIKSYRQFAQRNLNDAGFDITIDQGLILKLIIENPDITQQEIAANAFKDNASITRIIENLVTKKFLVRDFHSTDRRRFQLKVTQFGCDVLHQIEPTVQFNRKKALRSLSTEEISILGKLLEKISANCCK